jgi:DNA helicase-2/ATP-dependent DNA helicase PcrA
MTARHWEGPEGQEQLVETMSSRGDIQRAVFETEEEEACYVADRILHLRGVEIDDGGVVRGLEWGDMAVILRSVRTNARHFVEEFKRRGIPYVVRGTSGLFDHLEIKLVQATFCQLAEMDFSHIEQGRRVTLNDMETRDYIRNVIIELREDEVMPAADPAAFIEWIAEKRRSLKLANMRRENRPRGVSRRIYPQDIFHEMLQKLGATSGPIPWPDTVLYNLGRFSYLLTQFEAVQPLTKSIIGWKKW